MTLYKSENSESNALSIQATIIRSALGLLQCCKVLIIFFRTQDSVGVRFEDLKAHPQETIAGLCDWMRIEEQQSLCEMTAQEKMVGRS